MKTGKRILLGGLVGLTLGTPAFATPVYGITDANTLVVFDSGGPGTISSTVGITGLATGQSLVGIDFRPANGVLYGVSSDSRLYSIDRSTGLATAIGAAGAFTLSGTSFGLDFNPTVDRIRLTSNDDQNLRLNPNNGALAATDTALAFAAGDANSGTNPTLVGSAYTNSFAGATTTTLFGIDSALDILVSQIPPNAGALNTIGSLGFNTTDQVGFDIFAFGNQAFASLTAAGGGSSLFSINLSTGAATQIGAIGGGLQITDIAVQQVPEPGTIGLMAAGLLGMVASRRQRRVK